MALAEPRTASEWQAFRERLRPLSASDYPGADPAKFDEFKKAALYSQSNLVGLPIIVTVGFLSITEYVLQIVNWGAIGWLMALVVGAVGGGVLNSQSVKNAQSRAISLGRGLGLFDSAAPRPQPGPQTPAEAPDQAQVTAPATPNAAAPAAEGVPAATSPATHGQEAEAPKKRPVGLTVIAVFALLGGLLVFISALPFFGLGGRPVLLPSSAFRFIPPPAFGLILMIIAAVEVTFGAGAFMRKQWAWTLGVAAFSVGVVVLLVQQVVSLNPLQFFAVFLYALIIWYLFKPPVRQFLQPGSSGPTAAPTAAPSAAPSAVTDSRQRLVMAAWVAGALVAGGVITVAGMRLLGDGDGSSSPSQTGGDSSPAPPKSPPPSGEIVFSSGQKGENPYKIWVLQVSSGDERQITEGTENDFRPYWSPDGELIAFTRASQDGTQADIYLVNPDGTGVANLTKTKDTVEVGSAWSPDGSKLATTTGGAADTEGKSMEIEVLDADGTGRQRLTSNSVADYDPAWSPDGKKIAFVRGDFEDADIMVMDADGSDFRKLSDEPGSYFAPSWSPDGRHIVYSRFANQVSLLLVMNADGSGVRELTVGREAVWSPDGEWILFNEEFELYAVRPDGSERRKITQSALEKRFPSWAAR